MLTKYADCEITDVFCPPIGKVASVEHIGSFDYMPQDDGHYLYVAARACTADKPNLNYDMLPSNELKTAYQTFIGSPVYLNHNNQDIENARGVIIDAKWHDENPDDLWIECLMELDEDRCPKLCSLLKSGDINTFSMGCSIQDSECSICGNEAEYPYEYCEHIRDKGRKFGDKVAYEICHGVEFFELSAVYNPADPSAQTINVNDAGEKVASIVPDNHKYLFKATESDGMRKAAALKFGSVPDFMDFEQIDSYSWVYFPETDVEFLIECGEDDDWSWSIWEDGDETAEAYGLSSPEDAVEDLQLYIEEQKEYLAAAKSKSDYAYTPDDEPSHWKLDISDKEHAAAAKAALGKGYRGNKVEIPEKDRKAVIDKVNAACRKFGIEPFKEAAHSAPSIQDLDNISLDDYRRAALRQSLEGENSAIYDYQGWIAGLDSGDPVRKQLESILSEERTHVGELTKCLFDLDGGESDSFYGGFGEVEAADEGEDAYALSPRVPSPVDSQENDKKCPLCGSDAFDGNHCNTCGYTAPPEGFGDIKMDDGDEREKDDEEEDEDADEKE